MFGGNRTCLFTVADKPKVCDRVGAPNLGVAVDVCHVWWDRTLAETPARAQGRILGYHLCDWLEVTTHMLLDRGMMGDGVADLIAIQAAVEGSGYVRDPAEMLDVMVERFLAVC